MNILASRVTVRRIQLGPLARLSAPAVHFRRVAAPDHPASVRKVEYCSRLVGSPRARCAAAVRCRCPLTSMRAPLARPGIRRRSVNSCGCEAVSAGTAAPRMAAPRSGEYPATTAAAAPDSLANSRRENLVLMCGVHDSRRQRAASSDAKNEAASEL